MIALFTTSASHAGSVNIPSAAGSPFDLINAVNALRASYGLAPYNISPILMFTAQSQAEFMAATGDVSHTGFGGSSLTDRLLAAGYPLAGDLSLGGFRAENITSGNEDRSAQSAVYGWTGDALHLDTMISPNLSEIGAGVAIANGRVYYVIDAALPTTGEASASPMASITEVPASNPTLMQTYPQASPTTALLETTISVTSPSSVIPTGKPVDNVSRMGMVIGIVVLALLGGGYFTWLGSKKKEWSLLTSSFGLPVMAL